MNMNMNKESRVKVQRRRIGSIASFPAMVQTFVHLCCCIWYCEPNNPLASVARRPKFRPKGLKGAGKKTLPTDLLAEFSYY